MYYEKFLHTTVIYIYINDSEKTSHHLHNYVCVTYQTCMGKKLCTMVRGGIYESSYESIEVFDMHV